ncbi:MAG: GNAT family N-acetyltransferase [Gammaproteobacteria bacterium]
MSSAPEASLIDDPVEQGWDGAIGRAGDDNPMLLAGWHRVLGEAFSVRPLYLCVDPGSPSPTYAAFYQSRSLVGGNVLMSLDRAIAGPTDTDRMRGLIDALTKTARDSGARYGLIKFPLDAVPGSTTHEKLHPTLSVGAGADAHWDALSGNVRRKTRKASKEGYGVSTSDRIPDAYHSIFAARMRDLGTPTTGADYFSAINTHLAGNIRFISLNHGGRMVGGAFLVRNRQHWLNLYVAVEPEHQRRYGNYLLYWTMIEQVADEGGGLLDFGRSPREGGTHRFKRLWGTRDVITRYTTLPLSGSIPSATMDQSSGLKHEVWKRLPLPIATFLGPRLRRAIPFS